MLVINWSSVLRRVDRIRFGRERMGWLAGRPRASPKIKARLNAESRAVWTGRSGLSRGEEGGGGIRIRGKCVTRERTFDAIAWKLTWQRESRAGKTDLLEKNHRELLYVPRFLTTCPKKRVRNLIFPFTSPSRNYSRSFLEFRSAKFSTIRDEWKQWLRVAIAI